MQQNGGERTAATLTSASTDFVILSGLSLALFLYLMVTAAFSGYGYFLDEFYYIACSKRLAFGYVDHPPLSIGLLALSREILGESIPAIRFLPGLAIGATVFLTGVLARRLGGGRWAMIIAALAAMAMPAYLGVGSFYSMNGYEILLWTGILYLVIRLVQEEQPKYWMAIGILMGLGLEMKHTMVLYSFALVVGMLLTPSRRFLWNRWALLGIAACFALLHPTSCGNTRTGFLRLSSTRMRCSTGTFPRVLRGSFLDKCSMPTR